MTTSMTLMTKVGVCYECGDAHGIDVCPVYAARKKEEADVKVAHVAVVEELRVARLTEELRIARSQLLRAPVGSMAMFDEGRPIPYPDRHDEQRARGHDEQRTRGHPAGSLARVPTGFDPRAYPEGFWSVGSGI